jgi:hypothetical protein
VIDPDDERTALSKRAASARREAPAVAPDPDGEAVDERTLPARRSRAGAADAGARVGADPGPRRSSALPADIDATAVSARSVIPSDSELATQAAADSELATQAATHSQPAGPRRTAQPAPEDTGDDGTFVVRRSSRSATDPAGATAPGGASDPRARVASAPAAAAPAYRARPVPPAAASRAEPAPRAPQTYVDTAAEHAGRRRRGRRRVIVAAVAASVLVVVAAILLAVLLTTA